MNQEMEKKLSRCLDYLEQGETVEAVLSRFPEDVDVLRPFLEITTALSGLSAQPTVLAKQQSQAAFLNHAKALRADSKPALPLFIWLRRLLLPVAALAVMVFLFGATLVSVSATALPGDALYQVKRSVESYRLLLTNDPQAALRLVESYQENRISEIGALLLARRDADVDFEGEVQAIEPTIWVISGLPVQINQETELDEMPEIGAVVRVNGRTQDGELFAHRIVIIKGDVAPEPTPPPAITPAQDPAEVLLPTNTPQPTVTPTIISTPESTPTSTPLSSPTATDEAVVNPSVTPTVHPTTPPSDNANDNDDSTNDNDDDDNNDNGDDNGDNDSNDNGDDNSNDNGDDDSNDNGDDDSNDNGDDNSNDNGDDDSNDNGDDDSNDNGDDNSNGNGDDDSNDNGDDDSNDNGDDDSNDNSDDDGNSNDDDDDDE